MKSPSQNAELTQDEVELYDRQIRLWGVESQKRLRVATVLVIGMQGYGCEVAKNIILSGVQTVTLLDSEVVTEEDCCAQFLAPRDQLGQNRAEASLARAQQLNPMVQVKADSGNVADKPDSFFGTFDIICATKCSVEQLIRIDHLCRKSKSLFFCGDVYGMFGYAFADLGVHVFEQTLSTFPVVKSGSSNVKQDEKSIVSSISVETIKFTSLQDALEEDWTKETNAKQLKKMDPSYFLLKVLLRFRAENNRDPAPSKRAEDLVTLKELKTKELELLGVPINVLPDEMLTDVFAEISPVCAIVGGIMSQEIIKAVSKKEMPHNNFFFFNPLSNCGFIQNVGNQ